jgi:uncharacterized membrane protein YgaE (UPF0421/DUF939 family)
MQTESRRGRQQTTNQRRRIPWVIASGIQLALRAAVAAGLSVALAQMCKFEQPIYAIIVAVIVTDLSPSHIGKPGLRRLVAPIVGAACGATSSHLLLPSA